MHPKKIMNIDALLFLVLSFQQLNTVKGDCSGSPCQNSGTCTADPLYDGGFTCACDAHVTPIADPSTSWTGHTCNISPCEYAYIPELDKAAVGGTPVSWATSIDQCKTACDLEALTATCVGFVFMSQGSSLACALFSTTPGTTITAPGALYFVRRDDSVHTECSGVDAIGPQGLPGATGLAGNTGQHGGTGATGATGEPGGGGAGDTGATGNTGAQGPPGDTGHTGSTGDAGDNAVNGDQGYTGTHAIKGAIGDAGDPGDPGTVGSTGTHGTPGIDGDTGNTGGAGTGGAKGVKGSAGTDGTSAENGDTGATGPQGLKGDQAPQGTEGQTGPEGPKGEKGQKGTTGIKGYNPSIENECENGLAVCNSDPLGLAECVDLEYSYECRCGLFLEYGFTWSIAAQTCAIKNNPATSLCAIRNGGCEHLCDGNMTHVTCDCPDGFQLGPDDKSCVDIDECVGGEIMCEQQCVNNFGSYYCQCDSGYNLNWDDKQSCDDVDECIMYNGGCLHSCVNTAGDYNCDCAPGFELVSEYECLSNDKVMVNGSFDEDWNPALGDKESPAYKDKSDAVKHALGSTCFEYICETTFSEGSVQFTIVLRSASVSEFDEELEQDLVTLVRNSILRANGTDFILAGSMTASVIVQSEDNSTYSWNLDDICTKYKEEDYCVGDSHCEDINDVPTCVCPIGYVGLKCDMPGPGYIADREFLPRMEVIQLALVITAVVCAVVALIVTCGALALRIRQSSTARANSTEQFAQSERYSQQYPTQRDIYPGGYLARPVAVGY